MLCVYVCVVVVVVVVVVVLVTIHISLSFFFLLSFCLFCFVEFVFVSKRQCIPICPCQILIVQCSLPDADYLQLSLQRMYE